MRIAIASDAWFPQVNGVVRTLAATVAQLHDRGHEVELVTPDHFRTVAMPGYAEIRLAIAPRFGTRRTLSDFAPDITHIATEGPIGWSARNWCLKHRLAFTTSFHTRFPEYASVRTGISAERFWPIIKRFHAPSRAVLTATQSLATELEDRGFANVRRWSRGIDASIFRSTGELHPTLKKLPRPLLLNVGRVAPEKNLEAFLDLPVQGSKVVVGDGPDLDRLRLRYPDACFPGKLVGEELASAYRSADCFVFPSKTDTFGLVVIEALACGVPVAAYPVTGPLDILGQDGCGAELGGQKPAGAVSEHLDDAVAQALLADRNAAASLGAAYSWRHATDLFLEALHDAARLEKAQAGVFEIA